MTKAEMKQKAQDLIMQHLSIIGYGGEWEKYLKDIGNDDLATDIMFSQMNRVAKMFGYDEAWFS